MALALVPILAVVGLLAPGVGVRHVVVDGVEVGIPIGFEHSETPLGDKGHLLAVTGAGSALTLTIYRGRKRPSARLALLTHVDELAARVAFYGTPSKVRQTFLGRSVTGREFTYADGLERYRTRVVSRRLPGRTIVAAWVWPESLSGREPLSAVVSQMAVAP